MFKKRYFKAGYDFKTGFFCKLLLLLGFVLLFIFIIFKFFSIIFDDGTTDFGKNLYDISISTIPESILAFSLIFIAVGIILYFFECQFAKLKRISEEIEKDEEPKK